MESLWSQTWKKPQFESLSGKIKTDVLIIGGGMAGILCAYMLHRRGVPYVLAEARSVCGGITGNTTAKITSQHGLIYDKLIREFGEEKARLYFEANEKALSAYRGLCGGMDCDFEEKDSYVYSIDDRGKIEKEITALERLGGRPQFAARIPLPFPVAGAVKYPGQAQFHPLKFISSVSEGLNIYENTAVRELAPKRAVTERGEIAAEHIVVATHFPILNKHGGYFIKMYQRRSYVLALENAPNVEGMYIDEATDGLSFRNYRDLLLLGGGGHRTGKEGGNWNELRGFARKYYPDAAEKYRWASQDCMTLDGVPYIGAYSSGTSNLYVATGFNKWGMTSSMVAASVLCDMITGKKNQYAELFSPSRTVLRPQLAANAFESVISLLTPSTKRCPHLGCALKWNPAEHTWDCPCHGSRFTEAGGLIDNPATGDLKK